MATIKLEWHLLPKSSKSQTMLVRSMFHRGMIHGAESLFPSFSFVLLQAFLVPLLASEVTNTMFSDCSPTVDVCGNRSMNISYPFRVPSTPGYCGHPSFELTCIKTRSIWSIDIGRVKYRVTYLDYHYQVFNAMNLQFSGDSCPRMLTNTTFDLSLFNYTQNDLSLILYFNCSPLPCHQTSEMLHASQIMVINHIIDCHMMLVLSLWRNWWGVAVQWYWFQCMTLMQLLWRMVGWISWVYSNMDLTWCGWLAKDGAWNVKILVESVGTTAAPQMPQPASVPMEIAEQEHVSWKVHFYFLNFVFWARNNCSHVIRRKEREESFRD